MYELQILVCVKGVQYHCRPAIMDTFGYFSVMTLFHIFHGISIMATFNYISSSPIPSMNHCINYLPFQRLILFFLSFHLFILLSLLILPLLILSLLLLFYLFSSYSISYSSTSPSHLPSKISFKPSCIIELSSSMGISLNNFCFS